MKTQRSVKQVIQKMFLLPCSAVIFKSRGIARITLSVVWFNSNRKCSLWNMANIKIKGVTLSTAHDVNVMDFFKCPVGLLFSNLEELCIELMIPWWLWQKTIFPCLSERWTPPLRLWPIGLNWPDWAKQLRR